MTINSALPHRDCIYSINVRGVVPKFGTEELRLHAFDQNVSRLIGPQEKGQSPPCLSVKFSIQFSGLFVI